MLDDIEFDDETTEEDAPETMPEYEAMDRYREHLDEVYGDVNIGYLTYSTSHVLGEVDPTAFRCGFNDWLDSEGIEVE
jgi:hypothetical protein